MNLAAALQRSCDQQFNACANEANGGGDISVAECAAQKSEYMDGMRTSEAWAHVRLDQCSAAGAGVGNGAANGNNGNGNANGINNGNGNANGNGNGNGNGNANNANCTRRAKKTKRGNKKIQIKRSS